MEIPTDKLLQGSLENWNEVFGLLVGAVKDYAIFALDPNGHILTWNAGGERLTRLLASILVASTHSMPSRESIPISNWNKHPNTARTKKKVGVFAKTGPSFGRT